MADGKSIKQRADELALTTVDSFKSEIRPLIKRDFQITCQELKQIIKEEVVADLKPVLQTELKAALKSWTSQLKGQTNAGLRAIIKEELEAVLKSGVGTGVLSEVNGPALAAGEEVAAQKGGIRRNIPATLPTTVGRRRRKVGSRKSIVVSTLEKSGPGDLKSPEEIFARAMSSGNSRGPSAGSGGSDAFGGGDTAENGNDESHAAAPTRQAESGSADPVVQPLLAQEPGTVSERELVVCTPESGRSGPYNVNELDASEVPLTEREKVEAVINSERFELVIAVVITLNAMLIGISAEYNARHPGQPEAFWLEVLDFLFFLAFFVEICTRLFVYRLMFFWNESAAWNTFDFVLVTLQVLDFIMLDLPSGMMSMRAFRALRSIKVVRVLRLLRVFRLVRFISEMRTIFAMLGTAMRSLIGTLCLLTLILYLFGVSFTLVICDVKAQNLQAGFALDAETEDLYGTLGSTMLCLFESITGGIEWSDAIGSLVRNDVEYMAPVFCFYVFFCVFAMMNVVTGILVTQAADTTQKEQDAVMVKNIDILFRKGDLAHGDITWDEFNSMLYLPEMVELFKAINVDASEARSLFRLLDTQGVGILDYVEFISGCLRLRGPAKSMELAVLTQDHTNMAAWTKKRMTSVDMKLKMLCDRLFPEDEPGGKTEAEDVGMESGAEDAPVEEKEEAAAKEKAAS